jgi:hypothetical protein
MRFIVVAILFSATMVSVCAAETIYLSCLGGVFFPDGRPDGFFWRGVRAGGPALDNFPIAIDLDRGMAVIPDILGDPMELYLGKPTKPMHITDVTAKQFTLRSEVEGVVTIARINRLSGYAEVRCMSEKVAKHGGKVIYSAEFNCAKAQKF